RPSLRDHARGHAPVQQCARQRSLRRRARAVDPARQLAVRGQRDSGVPMMTMRKKFGVTARRAGAVVKMAALCLAAGVASGCSLLPDSIAGLPQQYLGEHLRISADFENVAGMYAGNEVA